jgi:Bifunctional DNA primase/polymerase, N-terminal
MRPGSGTVAWALAYARHGWPVLPLHGPSTVGPKDGRGRARCSCRSGTCEAQGKHPRTVHGLKDATTDPIVIRQWWRQWPRANVGLVTGTSFDVCDVDGDEALEALMAVANLDGLGGPMVCTGRGLHFYVAATGYGNGAHVLPGVDWRGLGGYVVAPPSMHYTGQPYAWVDGYGPGRPFPPCPEWLASLVRPPPRPVEGRMGNPRGTRPGYGPVALEAECRAVAAAPRGTRNRTLNRAAFKVGQLVAGGMLDEGDATEALTEAALATGLGLGEAGSTVGSGLKAGTRSPRATA